LSIVFIFSYLYKKDEKNEIVDKEIEHIYTHDTTNM